MEDSGYLEGRSHEEQANHNELYQNQLRRIKHLKMCGATKTKLCEAAKVLKSIKCALRTKRKATNTDSGPEASRFYPPPLVLPTDEEGFVVSFDAMRALDEHGVETECARYFFMKYGFVIFRGVLNPKQCKDTAAEIWSHLERQYPELRREVPSTYSVLSSKTYVLASEPAIFTPQIVRNRCNQYVVKALRLLLNKTDILVSHDRWCLYRPTKNIKTEDCSIDRPEWKTKGNLHLDLNPWLYLENEIPQLLNYDNLRDFSKEMNSVTEKSGPHVQGVLSILDNLEQDGGTVLVPGFHKVFSRWVQHLGPMEQYVNHSVANANRLVWRGNGAGSFKFDDLDPVHTLKHRILLRAGSFLVWDQLLVHGSLPNNSSKLRMAQFIKAFGRQGINDTQYNRRSQSICKHMKMAGTLALDGLKRDAWQVLGIQPQGQNSTTAVEDSTR